MHKCKILSFRMYSLKYISKYKIQINFFCDKFYVATGYITCSYIEFNTKNLLSMWVN